MKALPHLLAPAESEVRLPGEDLTTTEHLRKTPEPHSAITATHRQDSQQTIRLTGAPLKAGQVTVLMTKSKLKFWLTAMFGRNSPELK